jgi:hypothetical protein
MPAHGNAVCAAERGDLVGGRKVIRVLLGVDNRELHLILAGGAGELGGNQVRNHANYLVVDGRANFKIILISLSYRPSFCHTLLLHLILLKP